MSLRSRLVNTSAHSLVAGRLKNTLVLFRYILVHKTNFELSWICRVGVMSSLFTCMCVSALSVLVGGCETPQQHIDDVPIAGSIIDPPLLSCENHCEVRFADGVCRLDVTCLFAASSPASSSSFSFLDGGASGAASGRSFCRGHCVFEDTEGSCRLDLICLLQRDAAATREFLEQFGVYEEEVVEALALTGELGRLSSSRKEMRGETQCDQ